MEREEVIREACGVIRRHLPATEFKVFLFGSWAKHTAEPASDIDLAVLGPKALDDMLLLRLQEEIAAIPTLRRIDVVDLHRTDERFRQEVLSHGQPL
ncbi:MAG: nucleotidyltransferase domain-containing protein [Acidobacteria bacterium]|nr:MAG: nucleotidyltransferase domain-containing protein [Acidobacteriota bacterium]